MRTGANYRESLRDGRKVWVLGMGDVEDVTTHPATAAMVKEYMAWYDRHFDLKWQKMLVAEPRAGGPDTPVAFLPPESSADLRRLGKVINAVHFQTGGYITHTPCYGALIALGILEVVTRLGHSSEEISAAKEYRDEIARTGRFLTFASGGPVIGYRLREDPSQRAPLRLESETSEGVVISGKLALHTSSPYAEDVLITGREEMPPGSGRYLWFVVPVNTPGVRVVARSPSAHHPNPFLSPLSSRFDELDAQMWLDEVFVPRNRVFTAEPLFSLNNRHGLGTWLYWHQVYGWLAKAEVTLGVALSVAEVMGLKENPSAAEQMTDILVDVQTLRSCITAAELEPETSFTGYAVPGMLHVASASVYALKVRQHLSEVLRTIPGSSLVNAPVDTDMMDEEMAAGLEESYGGGGYTAMQRSALLKLTWDHIASSMDAREAAYELHSNAGLTAWRGRIRTWFDGYNELANGVHHFLGTEMPKMDLDGLRRMGPTAQRVVTPPPSSNSEGSDSRG